MEEEKEEAGSEEKDHIPPEDESSSTEDCLPEDEEKEKGIVFTLLELAGIFSGGFVSILSVSESKHVIKNIPWTTAKNFTVEIGQQQIEELISVSHNSIHSGRPHFLTVKQYEKLKESTSRYHYRACWGLPTRRKPIPRATASVYFVIVISKLKPDVSTQQWWGCTSPLRDKSTVAFLRQGKLLAHSFPTTMGWGRELKV
uniref:Uncharacterized protein n=1 Tax=Geospiza parvula TaxID=87175 RepID=A0A8C3NI42_GEOPR